MKKSLLVIPMTVLASANVFADEGASGVMEVYIDQDSNAGIYGAVDIVEDVYAEVEVAENGYGYIGAGYMLTQDTGLAAGYAKDDFSEEARIKTFTGHSFGNLYLRGALEYRHGFDDFVAGGSVTGDGVGSNSDVILPNPSPTPPPEFFSNDSVILPNFEPHNGYTVNVHHDKSQIVKFTVGADYNLADQVKLSYDYDYFSQLGDYYGAEDAQSHTFKAVYTGSDIFQPYVKHAVDQDFNNGFTTLGIAIPF
ncbi:hypothetical protein J4N45_07745 [Vibrio sp. SCSIO 43140]|uniref:hypothetical protein n=1 Tax=Vibrio sp. SCSIO 43140 TaxID=2819100 RepID=UPI0020753AC0|nr:hypothetical protein [Vibrio sp. SCSIO 43140]USD61839.1 hypothetical protein J4N45_07745 [Vibrio sp. SCSIO 43140]